MRMITLLMRLAALCFTAALPVAPEDSAAARLGAAEAEVIGATATAAEAAIDIGTATAADATRAVRSLRSTSNKAADLGKAQLSAADKAFPRMNREDASPGALIKPPLATRHRVLIDSQQDETSQDIDVYYPSPIDGGSDGRFPLISFAHGMYGGSFLLPVAYGDLLHALAGFGFIVVAPRSCNIGCHCPLGTIGERSLPHDPPCFQPFYEKQLRAITWARAAKAETAYTEEAFAELDVAAGAGVAGHSMGGQAAVFSSSGRNATLHDIRAAVMLHAYTHAYPAPTVPFLAFTGTGDDTAPPAMAHGFFDAVPAAARAALPRGLVNRVGATHHEVDVEDYNPLLAQYTAGWLKLFLQKRTHDYGIDFEKMIFGDGKESMCGGGGGAMAECDLFRPAADPAADPPVAGAVGY